MKKRFLSAALALAMCLGLAVPAFAALPPKTADEAFKNVTWEYSLGNGKMGSPEAGPTVDKKFNIAWYGAEDMEIGALDGYRAVRADTEFTLRFDKAEDDNCFIQICIKPYVYYGDDKYDGNYMWEESPRVMVLTPNGEFDYNINATESKLVRAGESVKFKLPTIYSYGGVMPGSSSEPKEMTEVIYRLEFRKFYPDTAHEVPGMHGPETAYEYLAKYADFKVDAAAVDSYLKENPDKPEDPKPSDPVTPAAPAFTDVKEGAYYEKAVQWAVAHEPAITNGTSDTTFEPDTTCTQLQILTFLYRAAQDKGEASATDLVTAAKWAMDKGIIGDGFDGNKECTRATAVSYIWQALGSEKADKSEFKDVAEDADYAAAVDWAVANGITNGTNMEAGEFSPDETCTRGQIVTFLHRAYVEEARISVEK